MVKCTLVQVLRLCTGCMAHRGSRGIPLLLLGHGTRRGWRVSVTHWPLFAPGKTRYQFYRRLDGPQGQSGQVRKISPPPGFYPRTVQPVTSCHTDWAIQAHNMEIWNAWNILFAPVIHRSVIKLRLTQCCILRLSEKSARQATRSWRISWWQLSRAVRLWRLRRCCEAPQRNQPHVLWWSGLKTPGGCITCCIL